MKRKVLDYKAIQKEFDSDDTFQVIADRRGVTKACISKIYRTMPGMPSGMKRRSNRAKKIGLEEALQIFAARFAVVIAEAEKHGVKLSPVLIRGKSGIRSSHRFLYAGRHLCRFSANRIPHKVRKRAYWYHAVNCVGQVKFEIFQVGDGSTYSYRFFIWPSKRTVGRKKTHIPAFARTHYHKVKRSKVDLLRYEDRWEFLTGKLVEGEIVDPASHFSESTSPA